MKDPIFSLSKERSLLVNSMNARFLNMRYPIRVRDFRYKNHIAGASIHDFGQVWYCVSGKYRHHLDGKDISVSPGMMIIVPPGALHGFVIGEKEVELCCIDISYSMLSSLSAEKKYNALSCLFLPRFSEELGFEIPTVYNLKKEERDAAAEIFKELLSYDFQRNIQNIKRIPQLLEKLFSQKSTALLPERRRRAAKILKTRLMPIMDAVFYMNEHFSEKITKEDLVAVSAICQCDFFRLIKKTIGYTFAVYLQQLRIITAQRMIGFSTYSFPYIADMCGFGNVTYMGRVFKKYYGYTMSRERSQRKALLAEWPEVVVSHESFSFHPGGIN